MEEGWQVSTGGRRRRKCGDASAAPVAAPCHGMQIPEPRSIKPPTERQLARCCEAVAAAAAELAGASLWAHLQQQLASLPPSCALPALRALVIYGLGSLEQPGAVHIRYQLAAAKLLVAALPALAAAAEAFDPVFTPLDHAVLAHCGIQVCPRDEGGRRVAHHPTLFFMPHCEAALTDALLAANLEAGTLGNLVILGNRFSGYQHLWALPHRAQRPGGGGDRPTTMLRLCEAGAAQEVRISESGFPVASAFNDLGLHWFHPDWRLRLQGGPAAAATPAAAPEPVS